MSLNLFESPKLTKPVQVYDSNKSVQENMNGQGSPSAQEIIQAYQTPQARLQLSPAGEPAGTVARTPPAIDPNSATSGMDAIIGSMYTSPAEEEKMRKASVANQRMVAFADALRNIGNIYNTVNGAPSQQFNNPVNEAYERYQKGKVLRDAANMKYLGYQQQKAALDAKQKQWERQFAYTAAKDAALFKQRDDQHKATIAERARQADQRLDWEKSKHKDEMDHKDKQDKALASYRQQTIRLGYGKLHEMSRHNRAMEDKKGRDADKHFPLKTPYGKMKVPGSSIPQAQLNQAYKDFEDAGWVKRGELQERLRALGVNSKADPDYVQNRIVEEIIASNGAAADYMRDNFGWEYENDSRGAGMVPAESASRKQTVPDMGYTPVWRGGRNLGTGIGNAQQNNGELKLGLGL